MANYGITALSGLPGAMDRQDRRNDRRDRKAWQEEYRGQQRKQWNRADEKYEAGAENRDLSQGNEKMRLLVQQGDLERKQLFQKLQPAFQAVNMDDGNKDDHGQAMAQILSGVNAKEIEFVPTEDGSFQFKSKDGMTYGFRDFEDARTQIGLTFKDPIEFLKKRAEAMNEEGIWVTPDGQIVQKKRGEAEREGLTSYAIVAAQAQIAAENRKGRGDYKTVETNQGILAYNEKNPNQRVALGGLPVSEKDKAAKIDARIKVTKEYREDLAFVLTPFAKPGTDMTILLSGDGLTEPAKNALEAARSFYEQNNGKEETLSPTDRMKFNKAKSAVDIYNHMSQTVINKYDMGGQAMGGGAKALSGPTNPVDPDKPPANGARKAPDGNWYISDPKRPGKYIKVNTGVAQ
ncbi:MAG: hypothetical protein GY737_13820 [Desulfobacteraceae bacterium]|nr:hypothetical protein [Desulfobacteraceae bacterium]